MYTFCVSYVYVSYVYVSFTYDKSTHTHKNFDQALHTDCSLRRCKLNYSELPIHTHQHG